MKRNAHIYATDAQMLFLRRLVERAKMIDSFNPPLPYSIELRRSWLKSEAAAAISAIKASIAARRAEGGAK